MMQKAKALLTKKVTITTEHSRVTLTTRGGGDCALHAILGQWNRDAKEVVCDDIPGKREKLRRALEDAKSDKPVYKLMVAGIEELLISGQVIGEQNRKLQDRYQKFLDTKKKETPLLWQQFEAILRQQPAALEYVQTHGQAPGVTTLYDQFYRALNDNDGELYGIILSLPPLQYAFEIYNRERNKGFDWQSALTLGAINEYAAFVSQPRMWLLPSDVAIIADVFGYQVTYYPAPGARGDIMNRGLKRPTVMVQFDGIGHYEQQVTAKRAKELGLTVHTPTPLPVATLPQTLTAEVTTQSSLQTPVAVQTRPAIPQTPRPVPPTKKHPAQSLTFEAKVPPVRSSTTSEIKSELISQSITTIVTQPPSQTVVQTQVVTSAVPNPVPGTQTETVSPSPNIPYTASLASASDPKTEAQTTAGAPYFTGSLSGSLPPESKPSTVPYSTDSVPNPVAVEEAESVQASFQRIVSSATCLPPHSVTIGKKLGNGAFGQVFRGEWAGRGVALKEIALEHAQKELGLPSQEILESFEYELARLSTLSHPNLVEFYGVYQHDDRSFLVMELCEGGSLRSALDKGRRFTAAQQWQLAFDMIQGLLYLHRQGVVHRDLKADNILLTANDHAKLADLGVVQTDIEVTEKQAKVVDRGLSDYRFKAPEDLHEDSATSSQASDVFAYGLILWEMYTGQVVSRLEADPLRERLRETAERERIPTDCPREFKQLMQQCWDLNVQNRPSAMQISQQLADSKLHPHAARVLLRQYSQILCYPRRAELAHYQTPLTRNQPLPAKQTPDDFWQTWDEKSDTSLTELQSVFDAFFKDPAQRVLVLVGDSGVGKTLASYREATRCLERAVAEAKDGATPTESLPLPVLLRPALRKWSHGALEHALENALSSKVYPLKAHLTVLKKQALVCFIDGWDELRNDQAPKNIPTQLRLEQWPRVKLVISLRPHAITSIETLKHHVAYRGKLSFCYLLPFSNAQQREYLQRHLTLYPEKRDTLITLIDRVPSLRAQLRNPLALRVLAKTWPRLKEHDLYQLTRYQLYELSIRQWLDTHHALLKPAILAALSGSRTLTDSFLHMSGQLAGLGLVQQRPALRREDVIHDLSEESDKAWLELTERIVAQALEEFNTRRESTAPKQRHRLILSQEDYKQLRCQGLQQFLRDSPLLLTGDYCDYRHRAFYEYLMTQSLIAALEDKAVERVAQHADALRQEPQVLVLFQERYAVQPSATRAAWKATLTAAQEHAERHAQELAAQTAAAADAERKETRTQTDPASVVELPPEEKTTVTTVQATALPTQDAKTSGEAESKHEITASVPEAQPVKAEFKQDITASEQDTKATEEKSQTTPPVAISATNPVTALLDACDESLVIPAPSLVVVTSSDSEPLVITPERLIKAARQGDLKTVEALLAAGVDPNDPAMKDFSLLQAAAEAPDSAVFERLLETKATVTVEDEDGRTLAEAVALESRWIVAQKARVLKRLAERDVTLAPILHAATLGDEKAVMAAVQAGNGETRDSQKITALHYAAANDHLSIVQWLLREGGASVAEKADEGVTALLAAAYSGHLEVVKWLLSKEGGAKVTEQDNEGRTALTWAANEGQWEVVRWLLNEGEAKADEKDRRMISAELINAAKRGDLGTVQWLVREAKATVAEKDKNGWTGMLWAAAHGHLEVVKWLLSHGGASVAEETDYGNTALLIAAFNGCLDIVQWLLREGDASVAERCNNGFTALLNAAAGGRLDVVKWLLSHGGASVAEKTKNGATALLCAAARGHLDVVEWLLRDGGAKITEQDNEGRTALTLAANNNHWKVVRWLLNEGEVKIDEKDRRMINAGLINAAQRGDLDTVQWLVREAKASMAEKGENGATALLWAAEGGHLEVVKWLLSHGGASVAERDSYGNTALLVAALNGQLEMVKSLLREGSAKVTEQDNDGRTALTWAANVGQWEVVRWLLNEGEAKADEKDRRMINAELINAAKRGDLGTVQWLLREGGASVTERDKDGRTALLLAAYNGHLSMVQWLLSREGGASLAEKGEYGWTALLNAAAGGHLEMVKWLLSKEGGASVGEKSNYGNTALLLAAQNGQLGAVQWLLCEGGASVAEKTDEGITTLLAAAAEGHLEVVKWLLREGGASVTEKDKNGWTAMLWAAAHGRLEVVTWLLSKEGGASVAERNNHGSTALLVAAANDQLKVVEWLLNHGGASVAEKDKNGWTAMLWAAAHGRLEVVTWLLSKEGGASVAERNNHSSTALLVAAANDQLKVVEWLLNHGGASVAERDKDGLTALLWAAWWGHLSVVQWLLREGGATLTEKDVWGRTIFDLVKSLDSPQKEKLIEFLDEFQKTQAAREAVVLESKPSVPAAAVSTPVTGSPRTAGVRLFDASPVSAAASATATTTTPAVETPVPALT